MGIGAHLPDAIGQGVEVHTYFHSAEITNDYNYT
jgi:hypothetical protein